MLDLLLASTITTAEVLTLVVPLGLLLLTLGWLAWVLHGRRGA